jgi:hypothetical protein
VRFLHQLVELGVAVDAALGACLLSRELALPFSIFHLTEKETEYKRLNSQEPSYVL